MKIENAKLTPHWIRLYHNENPYFERSYSPEKPIHGHLFSPEWCFCLLVDSNKYKGKLWMVPNILLKEANQAKGIDQFAEEHRLALISPEQIAEILPPNENKEDTPPRKGFSFTKAGEIRFSKMIILGAGASFDTGNPDYPSGIPITRNLFDDSTVPFLKEFSSVPKIKSLVHALDDLEEAYEQLWEEVINSYNPESLLTLIESRFLLASLMRYYSHKIDTKHYNYLNLMKLINRSSVLQNGTQIVPIIITFNYDTLFEQAAAEWGYRKFQNFRDYAPFPTDELNLYSGYKFLLFKPHGSCNWFVEASAPFPHQELIAKIKAKNVHDDLLISLLMKVVRWIKKEILAYDEMNKIDILTDINPWTGYISCYPVGKIVKDTPILMIDFPYPFLLAPFKRKDRFTMPYALRDAMTSSLEFFFQGEGKEIIVIGWKGNEKHFWDLIDLKIRGMKEKVRNMKVITITANDKSAYEQFEKRGFQVINFYDVDPEKDPEKKGTFSSYIKYCLKNPNGEFNFFKI